MDVRYLQTFRTIVEEGSFTRAAEKLNYTQSTITFQMKQLEKGLDVQLFEKIGRQMVLTRAGQALIPYADNVVSALGQLADFHDTLSGYQGELRVDMGESLLCYRMAPVLKELHRLAPEARLHLKSTNCYEILEKIRTGQTDLGVFYLNVANPERDDFLQVVPMGECTMDLVASPGTRAAFPDFVTPERHMEVPFIIDEPDCVFRQIFEAYLRSRNITLGHTIELWSIPTIINLVKNDVGISYLPSFTVADDIRAGTLCRLETGADHQRLTAVCAFHKNKWISPLMKLFIRLATGQPL